MGVNITTIIYLGVLIIQIGSTIILMVVEAQGKHRTGQGLTKTQQNLRINVNLSKKLGFCLNTWKTRPGQNLNDESYDFYVQLSIEQMLVPLDVSLLG